MVFKVTSTFLTLSLLVAFFALEVHSLSLLDTAEYELRILNGTKATKGKYLTQVSLQRRNSKGRFSHFCGGSILNDDYVLTAAHCVHDDALEDLRVVSATTNLREKGRAYKVSKIISHKNYTEKFSIKMGVYVLNDIALLKVSPKFRLRSREATVTLPYRRQKFSRGEVATVIGWGAINETGTFPGKLYEVDIFLVGDKRCDKIYGSDGVIHRRQHICAGVLPGGGRGDCRGDGGGPLFVRGVQVGVVSFGSGPCGAKPGVYTKISHFLPWIKLHAE